MNPTCTECGKKLAKLENDICEGCASQIRFRRAALLLVCPAERRVAVLVAWDERDCRERARK